jgi:hypothetical protein
MRTASPNLVAVAASTSAAASAIGSLGAASLLLLAGLAESVYSIKGALISKYTNIDIEVHTLRYRSASILQLRYRRKLDIEAASFAIEETSISKKLQY